MKTPLRLFHSACTAHDPIGRGNADRGSSTQPRAMTHDRTMTLRLRFRSKVRRMPACIIAGAVFATSCSSDVPAVHATLWPEADAIFHRDTRWIGGDGAYSIDLGGNRVLWLFGDSFIARTEKRVRSESVMIRNSVAIQTGRDPSRAFLQFYWPEEDGQPVSFAAEQGAHWFWPAHGIRLDDTLLLFFERVATPDEDPNGFKNAGWTAFLVRTPDAPPSAWTLEPALLPAESHGLQLGEAVLRDGNDIVVYATGGDRHAIRVARFSIQDAKNGDLRRPAWWNGGQWKVGAQPKAIIAWGSPELSVHADETLERLVMFDSQGYGTTTLAMRVADRPEGPWSNPRDVIRPPESHVPGRFNYAGKAHPALAGADLVVTYVPSTFDPPPQADEDRFYYPRFVRVYFR